jgi:hypothetical protein
MPEARQIKGLNVENARCTTRYTGINVGALGATLFFLDFLGFF